MASFFKGNLHAQTTMTDGDLTPDTEVKFYKDNGYQFLSITDHNVFSQPALDQLRAKFEVPGTFILIPGEEVTDNVQGTVCHLNGWGVKSVIGVVGGTTLGEAIRNDFNAMMAANVVVCLNHPVSVTASDLLPLAGLSLFEVYNPAATTISFEALWDAVLTAGKQLYGVAADDSHTAPGSHSWADCGTCWTMVRAEALTADNILRALQAGDFYSSSGVNLRDVRATQTSYSLDIDPAQGTTYTTEFVGANGTVLASSSSLTPTYVWNGSELYVRARVRDSQGTIAWTQPLFRQQSMAIVSVSVSPVSASLTGSQTQQFTASVLNAANQSVTWSLNPPAGSISAAGLYTAPASMPADQTVMVTATSVADATKSASASVSLSASLLQVAVQVAPGDVTLDASGAQQFAATVTGTTNQQLTWSVNPAVGAISADGLYTAPLVVAANQTVTVTATSTQDPSKSSSATVELNASVETFNTIRMHAGTQPLKDAVGDVWMPDTGFSAGSLLRSTSSPISGTDSPAVYQTERYANGELDYRIPVPNGTYSVRLGFAEIFYTSEGQRAFNVILNGVTELAAFDVFNDAGGAFAATGYEFNTAVTNGEIRIQFVPVLQYPSVSTIEVALADAGAAPANIAAPMAPLLMQAAPMAPLLMQAAPMAPLPMQAAAGRRGGERKRRPVNTGVRIAIQPRQASLKPGESLQFSAKVKGAKNQGILWRLEPAPVSKAAELRGIILRRESALPGACPCSRHRLEAGSNPAGALTGNGYYTAPIKGEPGTVATITATSLADPTQSASASIRLTRARGKALKT